MKTFILSTLLIFLTLPTTVLAEKKLSCSFLVNLKVEQSDSAFLKGQTLSLLSSFSSKEICLSDSQSYLSSVKSYLSSKGEEIVNNFKYQAYSCYGKTEAGSEISYQSYIVALGSKEQLSFAESSCRSLVASSSFFDSSSLRLEEEGSFYQSYATESAVSCQQIANSPESSCPLAAAEDFSSLVPPISCEQKNGLARFDSNCKLTIDPYEAQLSYLRASNPFLNFNNYPNDENKNIQKDSSLSLELSLKKIKENSVKISGYTKELK